MRGRGGLLLLVVVAGAVAFFVLRGGDDGGRQVSHAQLVREVNAVCEELVAAGRALDPPFRPYSAESESYFSDFLDRVEDAKRRLKDLKPPAADEAVHDSLIEGYTSIETDLEEAQGAAATDQDPEVIARINEIEAATKPMVEAEKALGVCKGDTSVAALPGLLRRTVPNPLSETGEL